MAGERVLENAVIRIKPSFVGFRSALRAGVDANTTGVNAVVGITFRTAGLKERLAAAARASGATLEVGVDLKGAEARMQEFHRRWNGKKITLTVDVDTKRATAAMAGIGPPGNKPPTTRGTAGGENGRGGRGTFRTLNNPIITTLTNPALLSAASTALVAATGATLALAGAFVTAGTAAGAFAGAAIGHVKQLQTVLKQTAGAGEGAFKPAADGLRDLQSAYGKFLDQTRAPVLGTFTAALQGAASVLPVFVPLVNTAANALTTLVDRFAEFGTGGEVQQFLGFVSGQAPSVIQSLGTDLLNLAKAVMNTVEAFRPLTSLTLGGLEGLTARLADFTAGLSNNVAFKEFLADVVAEGPRVFSTLADVADALVHVAVAAAPVGAAIITVVDGLARITSAIPTPVLTVFIGILAGAKIGSMLLGTGLGQAALGMAGLGATATVTTVAVGETTVAITTATAATNEFKLALVRTGIGAVIVLLGALAANYLSSGSAAEQAASGNDKFNASQQSTIDLLTTTNGLLDENSRRMKARELQDMGAFNVPGVDPKKALEGYTGQDDAAFEETKTLYQKRADELNRIVELRLKKQAGILSTAERKELTGLESVHGTGSKSIDDIGKQANAAKTLIDEYTKGHISAKQLADAIGQLNAAGVNTSGIDAQTDSVITATNAWNRFNAAMQETDGEKLAGAITSAHKAVVSANRGVTDAYANQKRVAEDTARANVDAAKRVVEAKKAEKEANERVTESVKNLADAYETARRKLRDQPDTEESLKINLAETENQLRLTSGLAPNNLDRRKAVLDNKNAIEDLADFQKDKNTKGIENDPGVIAAKKQLRGDQEAAKDAHDKTTEAYENQTRTYENGERARADAARQTQDAIEQQGIAKAAYDKTDESLVQVGIDMGLTREQAEAWAKSYEAKIIADNTDAKKKLEDTMAYTRALILMSNDSKLTLPQALAQAYKELAPAKPTPVGNNPRAGKSRDKDGATGGPIYGDGTGTSDSVPAMGPGGQRYNLSKGEHIWTAKEVQAVGGHSAMKKLRNAAIGKAAGGAVYDLPFKVPDTAETLLKGGLLDKLITSVSTTAGAAGGDGTPEAKAGQSFQEIINVAKASGIPFNPPTKGQTTGGGHAKNSWHYKGDAVDFSSSLTDMNRLAAYFYSNYGSKLIEELHWDLNKNDPQYFIKKGQVVAASFYGKDSTSHDDHVHIAAYPGFSTGVTPTAAAVDSGVAATVSIRSFADLKKFAESGGTIGAGANATIAGGKKGDYQKYAQSQFPKYGWSTTDTGQLSSLIQLWDGESGWNPSANNPSSGAYGIPQSLPASKMASAGSDYLTNAATQINWGLKYIKDRYGTPSAAWAKWQARSPHWYRDGGEVLADRGAVLAPKSRTVVYNGTDKAENVGFAGMTRADRIELAQLIAQALQTRPEELFMDGEVVARKAKKTLADIIKPQGV